MSIRMLILVPLVLASRSVPAFAQALDGVEEAALVGSTPSNGDGFGGAIDYDGGTAVVGARGDEWLGVDTGTAEVFVRSGATWSSQQQISSSDGIVGDAFGWDVALQADRIVVGARGQGPTGASPGAAYVFERTGTTWTETARLTASDGVNNDHFGQTVALDGDTIAVASPDRNTAAGSVYVYVRSGTTWSEQARIDNPDPPDTQRFGWALSLSGDTLAVGEPRGGDVSREGEVRVFVRSGTVWSEEARLLSGDPTAADLFGTSVSLVGDTLAVGVPEDDEAEVDAGAVFVFARTGTVWTSEAKLFAEDARRDDQLGASVDLQGDRVAAGAPQTSSCGGGGQPSCPPGLAYVFERSGTTWEQVTRLNGSFASGSDDFGRSVGIEGDVVVVGAPGDLTAGVTYGFELVPAAPARGSTVERAKLVPADLAAFDDFGTSVAIDADTALVGAPDHVNPSPFDWGAAYVYARSGTDWVEQATLRAGTGGVTSKFGHDVDLDGDTAVVGAPIAGLAYVFRRSGTAWSQVQKLVASEAIGSAVAIDGDTVVAGAWGADVGPDLNVGTAFVFVRQGTVWTEQQRLDASDGEAFDNFGFSVAISEGRIALGAWGDDDGAEEAGSVYVFTRSGTVWSEEQKLGAGNPHIFDSLGWSVALDGDTLVGGAPNPDGLVVVFKRDATGWVERQVLSLTLPDKQEFGVSVALDGDQALVGGPFDRDQFSGFVGSAFLYSQATDGWAERDRLRASTLESSMQFGNAVDIDGHWLVVGARSENVVGNNSGAAYVFELLDFAPSFCDASDGALAACPCGNPGDPDSGCDIAQGSGGIARDVPVEPRDGDRERVPCDEHAVRGRHPGDFDRCRSTDRLRRRRALRRDAARAARCRPRAQRPLYPHLRSWGDGGGGDLLLPALAAQPAGHVLHARGVQPEQRTVDHLVVHDGLERIMGAMSSTRERSSKLRFHPDHLDPADRRPASLRLYERFGVEARLDDVVRSLRDFVQALRMPVVGGMLVGCSDEAEIEAPESFQRHFVRYLLPSIKPTLRSAFQTSNLGGRYEWRSGRVAESHFADVRRAGEGKCIVLKVNAHVGVIEEADGPRFGRFPRFGAESEACGALTATLAGSSEPFADDIARAFLSEGVDRIAALQEIGERHRMLFAAACHARLMARRATLDLQDHTARGPTLYIVFLGVTLNRPGHDTEIPCGLYILDRRGDEPHDEYCGLGDRPEAYRFGREGGRVTLLDDQLGKPRHARDHRRLVFETWQRGHGGTPPPEQLSAELEKAGFEQSLSSGARLAKPLLLTLLGLALQFSPIPAAMVLFAEGLVGVYHAADAHWLAREANDDELARAMLKDVQVQIEALPPERAEHVVRLLLQSYGR